MSKVFSNIMIKQFAFDILINLNHYANLFVKIGNVNVGLYQSLF